MFKFLNPNSTTPYYSHSPAHTPSSHSPSPTPCSQTSVLHTPFSFPRLQELSFEVSTPTQPASFFSRSCLRTSLHPTFTPFDYAPVLPLRTPFPNFHIPLLVSFPRFHFSLLLLRSHQQPILHTTHFTRHSPFSRSAPLQSHFHFSLTALTPNSRH